VRQFEPELLVNLELYGHKTHLEYE